MKKNLLKLFLIVSVVGNVVGLLLYSDSSNLPTHQRNKTLKHLEIIRLELLLRLEKASEDNVQLQAKAEQDRQRIEDLALELNELKEMTSAGKEAGPISHKEPSKRFGGRTRIGVERIKAKVKDAILGVALKDEEGKIIEGIVSEETINKIIRDILPFMADKDTVLDALLDVLGDGEHSDYQELTGDVLERLMKLAGVDRSFHLKLIDLVGEGELNSDIGFELLQRTGIEEYSEDTEFAKKLLSLAESADVDLRASILYTLEEFELDEVSLVLESYAFNSDEDPRVREAALRGIDNSKDYDREYLALLTHKDASLRAGAISKLSSRPLVPGLRERIHKSAKSESNPLVLHSIVNFIVSRGDETSIPVLREIEDRKILPTDLRNYAGSHRQGMEREAAEAAKEKE